MKQTPQQLDEYLRREAENLRVSPRPEAWKQLEQRLQQPPVRTVTPIYRLLMLAAGLTLLLGTAFWLIRQQAEPKGWHYADVNYSEELEPVSNSVFNVSLHESYARIRNAN
jgi:hypothetical protein